MRVIEEMDMKDNPIILNILEHKSIRKFKNEMPSDEVIETIVRAGKQAPFASQSYSILMSRRRKGHPYNAPLLFTLCVDYHKLELIMARRNSKPVTNDLTLMFLGIQDVALMAENMVIAGRSLGLGSCFLDLAMYNAEKIAKQYQLPKRVFPLILLVMGYPDENPYQRPRFPMEFTLFEDKYPVLNEDAVSKAMSAVDSGDIHDDYGFYRTDFFSSYFGKWHSEPKELLEKLKKCGFNLTKSRKRDG